MSIQVLIADDDAVFRHLIADILKREKYLVTEAEDGQQAIDLFFSGQGFDLCILDVMMPHYDGWAVLSAIRERSEVPVIMLTALGDERHELKGFHGGANEYIAKPFSYEIFLARLKALIRPLEQVNEDRLQLGALTIEPQRHRVSIGSEDLVLNRKEYQLLVYLVQNVNLVLSRDQLIDHIWGFDFEGDVRTVDTHIKMLRFKLGNFGAHIQTIRGLGYKLEVPDDQNHQF